MGSPIPIYETRGWRQKVPLVEIMRLFVFLVSHDLGFLSVGRLIFKRILSVLAILFFVFQFYFRSFFHACIAVPHLGRFGRRCACFFLCGANHS